MTYRKLITLLILSLLFFAAACQSGENQQQAFSVTAAPTSDFLVATAVPTAGPPPATRTPTLPPTETAMPTETATITLTPSKTLTATITPTPQRVDHYFFNRPFSRESEMDFADRTYPYGSTQQGQRQTHLGQDYQSSTGVPIMAVGGGTVYYAGNDLQRLFGPSNNYYGNLVVIEHSVPSPEGLPVYTLYGHLDRVEVETGSPIEPGERIGVVGGTGVAEGPHLHLEVRVGDPEDYRATRNPDLWIYPWFGFGTIAGRVTDLAGDVVYDVTVQIRAVNSDAVRYAYSYHDDAVNGDYVWRENFTYGDLPEGEYEITVSEETGRIRFRGNISITAGQTTFVEVELN